jgi:hypothetical protein
LIANGSGAANSIMEHNLSSGNAGTGYHLFLYDQVGLGKSNIIRDNTWFEDSSQNSRSGIALVDMDRTSQALKEATSQNDLATDRMHPGDFLSRWDAPSRVATMAN